MKPPNRREPSGVKFEDGFTDTNKDFMCTVNARGINADAIISHDDDSPPDNYDIMPVCRIVETDANRLTRFTRMINANA